MKRRRKPATAALARSCVRSLEKLAAQSDDPALRNIATGHLMTAGGVAHDTAQRVLELARAVARPVRVAGPAPAAPRAPRSSPEKREGKSGPGQGRRFEMHGMFKTKADAKRREKEGRGRFIKEVKMPNGDIRYSVMSEKR